MSIVGYIVPKPQIEESDSVWVGGALPKWVTLQTLSLPHFSIQILI